MGSVRMELTRNARHEKRRRPGFTWFDRRPVMLQFNLAMIQLAGIRESRAISFSVEW